MGFHSIEVADKHITTNFNIKCEYWRSLSVYGQTFYLSYRSATTRIAAFFDIIAASPCDCVRAYLATMSQLTIRTGEKPFMYGRKNFTGAANLFDLIVKYVRYKLNKNRDYSSEKKKRYENMSDFLWSYRRP